MASEEKILYEANPSMFRNHPVQFVLGILLCFVIVGIPFLFVWWLRCKGTKLTVTNERTTLRRGILSKYLTEVMHENVLNIEIRQTFGQRIFGVGAIAISSAGQPGFEIEVRGIPDPEGIKRLIDEHRKS